MLKHINLSIRTKIVFITVSIMIFALGASTFIGNRILIREYAKALQSETRSIGQGLKFQLDRILNLGLELGDIVGFEKQCRETVEQYDTISYAMVMDLDGKILFHNDKSMHGKTVTNNALIEAVKSKLNVIQLYLEQGVKYYDVTIPIVSKHGQHIGAVKVGFPEKIISQKIAGLFAYSVSVAIVCLGLSIGFSVFAFSIWVTKPLNKLITIIRYISKEGMASTKRVEIQSQDEIGQLSLAFNTMINQLEESDKQIRKYAQELELEIKVRKRTEQVLRELSETLKRSNQELEQFAYVASHDLQEPLRMVASFTQLLAQRYKGKLSSDADEFIAYAVDGAIRMQGLINDLLIYSRVGTRGKDSEPTDCETVLEHTLDNLQEPIEESGAKVTHDPLPTVMADDVQLGQLFQNLIGNAIKFRNEEPPRVHVSVEKGGNEWIFSVRDNGIGIDPELTERIFIIFQRLHKREEYPGTGIGLAICKRVVERHSGRIWVQSKPGNGSKFYFTIPLTGGNSHE